MTNKIFAAARVMTAVVSGVAFAAIIGSGTAGADPGDCVIQRDLFGATAACHDAAAPAGREYVLVVDCWGLHGIPNAFPLYAIGPYSQSSRSFAPTGGSEGGCSTNWGAPTLNAGVITNAHVEIYRR